MGAPWQLNGGHGASSSEADSLGQLGHLRAHLGLRVEAAPDVVGVQRPEARRAARAVTVHRHQALDRERLVACAPKHGGRVATFVDKDQTGHTSR